MLKWQEKSTYVAINSFGNAKMERKVRLCIPFQLGNSFGNTQMERKVNLCIRFQISQFIWEY